MYIIFVYVCGYINRVPADSRCQKIDQVPFTHKQTPTQTHTCNVFVFVFVVRAHSTCPVTFSSTTFWLSFWLILFCLLLPTALARLFIYFACFVSFRKCRKANIAHTPRVRPSAKSISDCCPTNTYTCVCMSSLQFSCRTGQTRSCTIFRSILWGNETPKKVNKPNDDFVYLSQLLLRKRNKYIFHFLQIRFDIRVSQLFEKPLAWLLHVYIS